MNSQQNSCKMRTATLKRARVRQWGRLSAFGRVSKDTLWYLTGYLENRDLVCLVVCKNMQTLLQSAPLRYPVQNTDVPRASKRWTVLHITNKAGGRETVMAPGCESKAPVQTLTWELSPWVTSVGPLECCPSLRNITITHCVRLEDVKGLASCPELEWLKLRLCMKLSNLSPITKLSLIHI